MKIYDSFAKFLLPAILVTFLLAVQNSQALMTCLSTHGSAEINWKCRQTP